MGCRQHVPVWHERTREWVKEGRLVLLGITQEQHADRCRLFAQWKKFDWPILHDPINVLEPIAVPIVVAIDEHGIVRAVGPRPETLAAEFLGKTFADDAPPASAAIGRSSRPGVSLAARRGNGDEAWRTLGDALTLWGGPEGADEAIDAYARAPGLDPADGNASFRLGVAYRTRHDRGAEAGRFPGRGRCLEPRHGPRPQPVHLASPHRAVRPPAEQALCVLRLGRGSPGRDRPPR